MLGVGTTIRRDESTSLLSIHTKLTHGSRRKPHVRLPAPSPYASSSGGATGGAARSRLCHTQALGSMCSFRHDRQRWINVSNIRRLFRGSITAVEGVADKAARALAFQRLQQIQSIAAGSSTASGLPAETRYFLPEQLWQRLWSAHAYVFEGQTVGQLEWLAKIDVALCTEAAVDINLEELECNEMTFPRPSWQTHVAELLAAEVLRDCPSSATVEARPQSPGDFEIVDTSPLRVQPIQPRPPRSGQEVDLVRHIEEMKAQFKAQMEAMAAEVKAANARAEEAHARAEKAAAQATQSKAREDARAKEVRRLLQQLKEKGILDDDDGGGGGGRGQAQLQRQAQQQDGSTSFGRGRRGGAFARERQQEIVNQAVYEELQVLKVVVCEIGGKDLLQTELKRINREETEEEQVRQEMRLEKLLSN
eukprot:scaffold2363_cov159-Pinguiococcus_pyrenoidosus.AAC.2